MRGALQNNFGKCFLKAPWRSASSRVNLKQSAFIFVMVSSLSDGKMPFMAILAHHDIEPFATYREVPTLIENYHGNHTPSEHCEV